MASLHLPTDAPADRTWPATVRVIHWLVAALVVAQFIVAWSIPDGDRQSPLWQVHFSLGFTILLLMVARLAVRGLAPSGPSLPPDVPGWQRVLARLTQILFYVLLIAMPLSGWILVGFSGHGPTVYGAFTLPVLWQAPASPDLKTIKAPFEVLHVYGGWVLLVLISLHLLGALSHLVVRKDGVFNRMATVTR